MENHQMPPSEGEEPAFYFNRGYEAHAAGKSREVNPYNRSGRASREWFRGWDAAAHHAQGEPEKTVVGWDMAKGEDSTALVIGEQVDGKLLVREVLRGKEATERLAQLRPEPTPEIRETLKKWGLEYVPVYNSEPFAEQYRAEPAPGQLFMLRVSAAHEIARQIHLNLLALGLAQSLVRVSTVGENIFVDAACQAEHDSKLHSKTVMLARHEQEITGQYMSHVAAEVSQALLKSLGRA